MRPPAIWTLALGIALAPGAVGAPTFMGLGPARVDDLSGDGTTLAGRMPASGRSIEQARWTAGTGWVTFATLWGSPVSISGDGSVVIGNMMFLLGGDGAGASAWRWTPDGIQDLGRGTATGTSADGSVVVGLAAEGAFRWTAETGVFEPLGVDASEARVSADGSVVIGASAKGLLFRWTPKTGVMDLGEPFGLQAVSAEGSVAVGLIPPEALRWTEDSGTMGLGFLPGHDWSLASDVSADGSLVVGISWLNDVDDYTAFLWDRTNGMQSVSAILTAAGVDLTGWRLGGDPYPKISDDGRTIAGGGTNPDGFDESWIATLDCPNDDDCDTVLDADDNCPGLRTTNINDANGNGIGDMCECGDQTGDGQTDMADIMGMVDVIFDRSEASPLCDTNDDDECNVADILGVNGKIFGAPAYCARNPTP